MNAVAAQAEEPGDVVGRAGDINVRLEIDCGEFLRQGGEVLWRRVEPDEEPLLGRRIGRFRESAGR